MAMDVEYEEYSSTSSSKHHGWKLEVSRRHRETQEMEALESRLAVEYAKIDQGLSAGDLTAPRAAKLIAAMDRSARLPDAIANGASRDRGEGMFLTYPDREGLCGALPTLAAFEKGEETRDAKAGLVARDPGICSRESLASRLADAMPLMRTRGGDVIGDAPIGVGQTRSAPDDTGVTLHRALAPRDEGSETKTNDVRESLPLAAFSRRPDRLVEYDVSIGLDRARGLTDAELNEMAGEVNDDGGVADTAFRDLNGCD